MPISRTYGMAQTGTELSTRFDVSKVGNRVILDTSTASVFTVQTETADSAISSAVLTVKVTNDPQRNKWQSHPDASTITAAGITRPLDCSGYDAVCVEVTTAEASKYLAVYMVGKG